jgi:RecJ-like exonuclease
MKVELTKQEINGKLLIKKCHSCGHLMESAQEPQKCQKCKKSFLPVNYFSKIHSKSQQDYDQLFAYGHELHEEDLIKGLSVLW